MTDARGVFPPFRKTTCMAIEIIRATSGCVDAIAPLFDAYRQFYGCSLNVAAARSFLADRLERGESVILLAMQDGRGVGFTQLYPTFTSIGLKHAWILNDLFVDPTARRTGVGQQLLEAAKQVAIESGAAWMELATATDNERAQALYRKCGWKKDDAFDRFKLTL